MGISEKTLAIDRNMILNWLRSDIAQLRKWAVQPHTIKSMIRVQCLRTSIHGCNVALSALKDREIDELSREIDLIKKQIEELNKK